MVTLQFWHELLDKVRESLLHHVLVTFFVSSTLVLISWAAFLFLGAKGRLRARRAWSLADCRTALFVVASIESRGRDYRRLGSGLGEIRAVTILFPSLVRAYREFDRDNLLFSRDFSNALYGRDLIILGGPKRNEVTKELFARLPELPYTMDEIGIIDQQSNNRIEGLTEQGAVIEDYGLIIKTVSPFNSSSRCFIFAGVHTYGVQAAAIAFAEDMMKLRYLRYSNYACLVRCRVTGHFARTPEIVKFKTFHRRTKTFELGSRTTTL